MGRTFHAEPHLVTTGIPSAGTSLLLRAMLFEIRNTWSIRAYDQGWSNVGDQQCSCYRQTLHQIAGEAVSLALAPPCPVPTTG